MDAQTQEMAVTSRLMEGPAPRRAPARVQVLGVAAALASVLVCSPQADAQITVPSSTLPVAGDTLKLAVDNAPGACAFTTFTPPGLNQTWDLSCLKADATRDVVYRPVSEGSATVPGATMFAVVPPTFPGGGSLTNEEYYSVTGGRLQLHATYGRHFDFAGETVFSINPPLAQRYAPLNFFDIKAASSGVLASADASAFSPLLLASLHFAVDSLRYRVAIGAVSAVDAGGTMNIPGGTYNVLREKRTTYTEYRIDAKVPPLGWLDITDVVIQSTGAAYLGVDTVVHHSYYNDVEKEPIAVVQWNNAQNTPVRVTFKNVQPVCQRDGDPCGDQSSSACNLADTCMAGVCVPNLVAAGTLCGGSATACSNADTCDGAGACLVNDKPNGTTCSDGNACTAGDTCQNGTCTTGAPVNCNDGNACTTDSCNTATGCVHQPDPVCAPPIALVSAVQQVESCAPANGVLDPGERVTYAVTLRNTGAQPTTNLVATLLPSASVSAPGAAQRYGVIPAGGSATKSFTWTGLGACGVPWSAVLALTDGAQSVPSVTVTGLYGAPGGVCNAGCAVVRLATKTTLSRNGDGTVRATVKVNNTGSIAADNVVLTIALLGTSGGTPLPQPVNTIAPGGSQTVTVTFPASVLAGAGRLKLGGTYAGGTFSTSSRVTVP